MPARFGHWLAAATLSLACALPQSGAGQQVLGAEELRSAAMSALQQGDPATARRYAEGLVARDASDRNAYLILARAARDMGDIPPARAAARQAWDLAETDAQKYSAALITAQVLSSDGKRTRAQLWLRRAAELAPSDVLRARAARDFQYVRLNNPWKTDITLTFAPNSNINNGSARDRSRLNYAVSELLFGEPIEFELTDEAQAISGIELGAAVRTRYRFSQSGRTAHDAKASLSYRTFLLTEDLEDDSIKGSDFAFGTLAAGYGFRRLSESGRGEFAADLEAGQSWYGGARYARYLRTQAQQSWQVDRRRKLRFGADLERQWGQATPDRDSIGLSASITQGLNSGNTGFLGLYATETFSPDVRTEYTEVTLRTGLALKRPVMGARLQMGLGASWRDYDVSRDDPAGRTDNRIFADLTATFQDIDYYGFNPTVTVTASHTDSNIGLYDVNRVGLRLGISSAF